MDVHDGESTRENGTLLSKRKATPRQPLIESHGGAYCRDITCGARRREARSGARRRESCSGARRRESRSRAHLDSEAAKRESGHSLACSERPDKEKAGLDWSRRPLQG